MPSKAKSSSTSYRGKSARQSDAKSKLHTNSSKGQQVHNARMREESEKRERDREAFLLQKELHDRAIEQERRRQIREVQAHNAYLIRTNRGAVY